ncbi:MAG: hypothetical protein FD176_885 [Rhodospirillaceae bacterium]|nr:MAG: hypothetical protein FD176_885 [Rhodospirillaceae bacterium]TNC97850.1 MAG: hypothetical protein FD119_838 [Stygiobacter sp.]
MSAFASPQPQSQFTPAPAMAGSALAPPASQAMFMSMGNFRYAPSPLQAGQSTAEPIQRVVEKRGSGRWYSSYDPYTEFATKAEATAYDKELRDAGYEKLRARTPTLYTYTHLKPHQQLTHTKQGPHTVAHKVILQSLVQADTKPQIKKLFTSQVPKPKDLESIMEEEEPDSGFNATLQPRIDRYMQDYQDVYDTAKSELAKKKPDLVVAKHSLNQLMNMHPYATSSWKSTSDASRGKLAGKGENKQDATFDMLVDKPSKPFNDKTGFQDFLDKREDMFDDLE